MSRPLPNIFRFRMKSLGLLKYLFLLLLWSRQLRRLWLLALLVYAWMPVELKSYTLLALASLVVGVIVYKWGRVPHS